jgi:hypothetical protein
VEEQQPKKACEICYIEVVEQDMVRIRGEVHEICLQCMEMYLKEEVRLILVRSATCGSRDCPAPIAE